MFRHLCSGICIEMEHSIQLYDSITYSTLNTRSINVMPPAKSLLVPESVIAQPGILPAHSA